MNEEKVIFQVTNTVEEGKEVFDTNNLKVRIDAGVTGEEMSYAIVALLEAVLAHENTNGNELTEDGLLNLIRVMMKDAKVGIPKEQADMVEGEIDD
jgi:hypothetical protein